MLFLFFHRVHGCRVGTSSVVLLGPHTQVEVGWGGVGLPHQLSLEIIHLKDSLEVLF